MWWIIKDNIQSDADNISRTQGWSTWVSSRPRKVESILKMDSPKCVTDIHRLGMVNYLARFLPRLSDVMTPLSSLHRRIHHGHGAPAKRKPSPSYT